MREYVAIIGLDERESEEIRDSLDVWAISHMVLPKIMVNDGQLWVEAPNGPRLVPANKVVYHGIFENDLNFMVGLALWGGPCLPNPRAMMDCRMKLPGLVRALKLTRFGHPRGYASPYAMITSEEERVAKWGNWHCGENKERFTGTWTASEESIIEPFFAGQAVRVVIIGDQAWQICLQGDDWLKSIHHDTADFMDIDDELLEDTENIRQGFGLEIIANDYIVTDNGKKYLLEVNHIPNVTRFPEMWEAYRDYVIEWVAN
ncbi:MAG: hypothetical protein L0154_28515 [Chloroflexi bacterium]|nr:hypothetical protein [Chloroflexota bacterium]